MIAALTNGTTIANVMLSEQTIAELNDHRRAVVDDSEWAWVELAGMTTDRLATIRAASRRLGGSALRFVNQWMPGTVQG